MKNQVKLAIFSFVVIFILESSAVSAQWTVESVDAPKNFHNLYSRSLALDANDHPHIAYGGDHLYYAVYDGIGWNYETVDLSTDVGSFTSMALDISGKVHISYYDIIIISTHTTKSFQSTELYLIWASVNTTVFCHCSQIVVSL